MFQKILLLFHFFISLSFFSADKDTIIVSKDSKGDFTSIQEAINQTKSFPYKRMVIFIKNGIYKEKVKAKTKEVNYEQFIKEMYGE